MQLAGILITNDMATKGKGASKNVEVTGIPNLCVLSEDPKKIPEDLHHFLIKYLINSTMFRSRECSERTTSLLKAGEKNGPEVYSKIQITV